MPGRPPALKNRLRDIPLSNLALVTLVMHRRKLLDSVCAHTNAFYTILSLRCANGTYRIQKNKYSSLFPQIVCKSFALTLIVTRKTLEECDNCSTPWNIGRITRHYLFNKFSRENLTLIKQQVPFYRICGDVLSTPRQPPSSLGGRRLETRTIGRWKGERRGGQGARGRGEATCRALSPP